MPGGYGIGAKGIGRCSEMSSSRHLMSQLCIKVPRGHVTVRLGTTSWVLSASLGRLLHLTGSAAAASSPCTAHFCLHVALPPGVCPFLLSGFGPLVLLYWPPFLFQTWHNFSLKPPTPQQSKCIDSLSSLVGRWFSFCSALSFDDSLPPSSGLQSFPGWHMLGLCWLDSAHRMMPVTFILWGHSLVALRDQSQEK